MAEDFAIVPESDIRELKDQISSIRRNPLGPYGGQDLLEAVNNLTKAINSLMMLFQTAAEELKLEERETETITRKIDPLLSRIEMISEQNRKIAQGVVAVADMLESAKIEGRISVPRQEPMPSMAQPMGPPESPFTQRPMPQPMMQRPMMQRTQPPGQMYPQPQSQSQFAGLKLPPVPLPKRKGLFG